jgi:riboflavin kinase/FMN adenylyltransferase
MQIVNDINGIVQPFKNAVVTIGNFDGVHKGHQAIFRSVIEKAQSIDGTPVVITFEPHPARVLKKNGWPPLITLFDQKMELISQTGIEVVVCIPFTEGFASMTAGRFVEDILIKKIGMKAIVIGKDYTFGKDRKGDVKFLKKIAAGLDFEVIVTDWIQGSVRETERISSTRVRELIMAGEVEKALNLLGRYYQIHGRVVSGRNRGGRLLGFPTANINLVDELCPKTGVYAVTVEFGKEKYRGVANIGYSPTFEDHLFTVEVHILDFEGDICGQDIRVNFVCRIRDEKRFAGIDELSKQITRDIKTARKVLQTL